MPVNLTKQATNGEMWQATFLPEQGMNLVSFKRGSIELIDTSTQPLFEERYAGLGAMIGPHFHRRHAQALPKIKDERLFPHIARVKAKNILDPFSHGIGRYAPWKFQEGTDWIEATLQGEDTWQNEPLKNLEGQNFKMHYRAALDASGLEVNLSVVSDTDSLIGLHYYLNLPNGQGTITSKVQSYFRDQEGKKEIPLEWMKGPHDLCMDLSKATDWTFYPFPNPLQGEICLDTEEYRLKVSYKSRSQENCWQLFHPQGASFVCIEPISAQDPRHPNLTVSSLTARFEIV